VIYELLDKKVHFITAQTLVQSGQHKFAGLKKGFPMSHDNQIKF